MNVPSVDIPEVQAMHQQARFFRDEGQDFVEISFVGSKDTIVHKVRPEHMARFRDEWTAFCDGVPLKKRDGTPLTDIKGMQEVTAERYISQNIHNMEELSALSDAQCQALGHGTLTFRNAAREALEMRKAQQMEIISKKISEASKSVQAMPSEEMDAKYASKADVDEIKGMLAQLLAAQTKRGPGRPPKTNKD